MRHRVVLLAFIAGASGCNWLVDTSGLAGGDTAEDGGDAASVDAPSPGDAVPVEAGDAQTEAEPDGALPGTIVLDTFSRTMTGGLGAAEIGGAWTGTIGAMVSERVEGGAARVGLLGPAIGATVALADVLVDDVDLSATVSVDKLGTGGGVYIALIGRRTPSLVYDFKVIVHGGGIGNGVLERSDSASTALVAESQLPFAFTAGAAFHMRMQVVGVNPSVLRGKAWGANETEPGAWSYETSDATPALQQKGGVGMSLYLSGSATNAPLEVAFDDFIGRPSQ